MSCPVATAPPVLERDTERRTRHAPLYKVLLHNDDVTPFDFVVRALLQVFKLPPLRALAITLEAHRKDVALVVVEPREHAEFHIEQTRSLARGRNYPLTLTMEPAA